MAYAPDVPRNKTSALLWCALCYLLCFSAAWAWLEFGRSFESLLLDSLVADILATFVIFAFSRAFRNSSFYDSYWSLAPPLFLVLWYFNHFAGAEYRVLLLSVVVGFWSLRLTANWIVHWPGLSHEDWRYAMLRDKSPKFGFLVDFFLIHLFPTIQVFLGMLPIYTVVCKSSNPTHGLDYVAFGLGIAAVSFEMIADLQLHRFIARRSPGEVMTDGLWAYSRHPNYFGEFMFWVSLSLFGVAALPEQWWWQIIGSLAMLFMFLGASIPMMEQKLAVKPGYSAVRGRISKFFPWPPRTITKKNNAS